MNSKTLQVRALVRAAKLLGGVDALSRHLGISQTRLTLYLGGDADLPDTLFLKVADVLVEIEVAKLGTGLRSPGNGDSAKKKRA